MPWNVPPEDLRPLLRDLATLQREDSVLVLGTFHSLWMKGSLYVYRRELGDTAVIVVMNAGPLPTQLPPSIAPNSSSVLSYAYEGGTMRPFGYAVWK